jgi:hypothetical protein
MDHVCRAAENRGAFMLNSRVNELSAFDDDMAAFYADTGRVLVGARQSLLPEQFKTALYAKGWTMKALADYWGISPEYVRRLAADRGRSPWWDNAIYGLPVIGPRRRTRAAWQHESATAGPLALSEQSAVAPCLKQPTKPKGPGFRYWGYMVLGAVVAVAKHLGEMADEGMYGLVLQVIPERTQERYRVIFETGEIEMFTPDLVDEYLVTTGIEKNGLVGYVWRGEEAARRDYEAGLFVFEGADGEVASAGGDPK